MNQTQKEKQNKEKTEGKKQKGKKRPPENEAWGNTSTRWQTPLWNIYCKKKKNSKSTKKKERNTFTQILGETGLDRAFG